MGSFRLTAGTWHLHHGYNFTGSVVETVLLSLRLSCRSELTRQGTSLRFVTCPLSVVRRQLLAVRRKLASIKGWSFLPASACRHAARTISSPETETGARRIVSE